MVDIDLRMPAEKQILLNLFRTRTTLRAQRPYISPKNRLNLYISAPLLLCTSALNNNSKLKCAAN